MTISLRRISSACRREDRPLVHRDDPVGVVEDDAMSCSMLAAEMPVERTRTSPCHDRRLLARADPAGRFVQDRSFGRSA